MQNALQTNANYDQHNAWYNSIFATEIKTEPGTSPIQRHITPPPAGTPTTPNSQLEQYLNRQHQQNVNAAMNATAAMTPSPQNNENGMQHFFNTKMQQQFYQQQQYQQQFQQAQQAAVQNHMAAAAAAVAAANTHMPLGFNPLTPPGLPPAALPTHYYNNSNSNNSGDMNTVNNSSNNNNNNNNNNNHNHNLNGAQHHQQTPSPQPCSTQLQFNTPMELNAYEKLQTALTPSNTPPMDTQILKSTLQSPLHQSTTTTNTTLSLKDENETDKEQDAIFDSSENLASLDDDAKFYESIYKPRYNSHGKLSTYPCKDCGQVFDTKAKFWLHRETHIKPEKMIRCPMHPRCPFSTDLKHWMEFHLRKHRNEKPYKCPEPGCKYSCETKGMLTSHMKSHSDIYPYKCADCDYNVKFVHSFKQHLRKYAHKPGVVLDDKGKPNPAAIIDVYGRRRGPKSKGGLNGTGKRDRSLSASRFGVGTSQLSAALQGIKMEQRQQQKQQDQPMCISPAKSTNSSSNDMPTPKHPHIDAAPQTQQQQQQQQQMQLNQLQQQQQQQLSNLLPPLASILQQNSNMAFFPYWNLNLQMLAAQQQAAVFAQLSPHERENALQQLQNQQQQQQQQQAQHFKQLTAADATETDDDEDNDEVEWKSVDSAMDLSQPADEERRTPENDDVVNLKMQEENQAVDTPITGSMTPSRRKGRVLQLDTLLQVKTPAQLAEKATIKNNDEINNKLSTRSTSEESLENVAIASTGNNTSASSTSNDSGTATSNESDGEQTTANTANTANSSKPAGAVHECKYCDIYFKDPVLYTIHMGYHSCDDVFKCNMCGEKCDSPVGLFVHMARNPHA